MFDYPYQIFYYGKNTKEFKNYIAQYITPETLEIPIKKEYTETETGGNVYFVNYDMVQVEMSKIAKGKDVDTTQFGKINVFNEYFGRGLSSIVFQEIRESKSLAYSAYVSYSPNSELYHPDYVTSYIGTQPDKLQIAVDTMSDLMSELPEIPAQFENARNAALKQIASTRITRTNVFFNTLRLQKLGVNYDIRKDVYSQIEDLDFNEMKNFYDNNVKTLNFNTALMGNRESINQEAIEKMGVFQELSLEDIFGY